MHKVVCFDFDDVLTRKDALNQLAFIFGPSFSELKLALEFFEDNKNPKKFFKVTRKIIMLGKGVKYSQIEEIAHFLKLNKNAKKVLKDLKSKKYKIVIVSINDENLIRKFLEINKITEYIDHIYAAKLGVKDGLLTGEIDGDVVRTEKVGVVSKIEKVYKVKKNDIIYIGDGLTDLPIMKKIGGGILFCPNAITNAEILADRELMKMRSNNKLFLVEDHDLAKIMQFIE